MNKSPSEKHRLAVIGLSYPGVRQSLMLKSLAQGPYLGRDDFPREVLGSDVDSIHYLKTWFRNNRHAPCLVFDDVIFDITRVESIIFEMRKDYEVRVIVMKTKEGSHGPSDLVIAMLHRYASTKHSQFLVNEGQMSPEELWVAIQEFTGLRPMASQLISV